MRRILEYILKILAKIVLWKYQPEIVAVTGSVGKTSTKEAIYQVLRKQFKVRRNLGNYNNEIGVPLTVLGLETAGRSLCSWLKNFFRGLAVILWAKNYPEILILELAVDKPGDMKYLTNFIPAKVGLFTAVGQFPVHLEFFPERGKLVEEKSILLKSLPSKGLAVLNYDDLTVRQVGYQLSKKIKKINYGFGSGADLRIFNYQLKQGDYGISFKLDYRGSVVPVKLKKVLGRQQAYAAAAAAAVGLHYGLNLVEIAHSLSRYRSPTGRTNLIKGIKKSWLIDDSYNSSPLAALAALEILSQLPAQRRIAVLGDMLELGQNTEAAHRQIGQAAAEQVDLLITVGSRARFIADQARQSGLAKEKVFEFSDPAKAALNLQSELREGDLVLVKASRAIHLEKVIAEIRQIG